MSDVLKVGLVGADISHAPAFARILNESGYEHSAPGARLTAFYRGGSPDWELSRTRVEEFSAQLRDRFGAVERGSVEEVVDECDAVMIVSGDGRVHLEQFRKAAPSGKPVYINKPFALNSADALAMRDLARRHDVALMSCSALRFAPGLTRYLDSRSSQDTIFGADCYGPGHLEATQLGLFWYGVHSAETLYTILGRGCLRVRTSTTDAQDVAVGEWADGRTGTIRCNRKENKAFGALIHSPRGSRYLDISAHPIPINTPLVRRMVEMFRTRVTPVDLRETLEIVRFLEAANESRETGRAVELKPEQP